MSQRRWAALAILTLSATALAAQARAPRPPLDSITLAGFRWRSVGPANMMGRVSSVAGIPSPSKTFFVAGAAGGMAAGGCPRGRDEVGVQASGGSPSSGMVACGPS